jgi:plastocyanin
MDERRPGDAAHVHVRDGAFPYIWALHDDLGMKGRVVVLP